MKDETRNRDRRIVPIQPQNDPSRLGPEPQGVTTNISLPDNRPLRVRALAAIDLIKNGSTFDSAVKENHLTSSEFFEVEESDADVEAAFLKAKDFARKLLVERALAIFQKSVQPLGPDTEVTAEMLRAATACLSHDGPLANDPNAEPAVPPALAELARALAQKKGNLTDDYDR